jgi:hypothetical protein
VAEWLTRVVSTTQLTINLEAEYHRKHAWANGISVSSVHEKITFSVPAANITHGWPSKLEFHRKDRYR